MGTRIQIVSIVATVGLFLVVFELVRRRRLQERYALLWLLAALVLFLLAAWQGLLAKIASAVGIFYPPSALFVIAFGFILVLLLHFSIAVSRLADQTKVLAQRLALTERRLRDLEEPAGGTEAPADGRSAVAEASAREPARR
ncbi:MAG: DUF2304 domain-containing protein [Thermoleophilaceae bacterium]|nr:DUF2304 domain-containing protein [Thermoleophilaceae bacterium]